VILLRSVYTISQGWWCQQKPIKQVAIAPQRFSKTAASYIKGESDCHHKEILITLHMLPTFQVAISLTTSQMKTPLCIVTNFQYFHWNTPELKGFKTWVAKYSSKYLSHYINKMWPEQHFGIVPHYRYDRLGFETLQGTTDILSTPIHTRPRPARPPVQ